MIWKYTSPERLTEDNTLPNETGKETVNIDIVMTMIH
jgi:hypothetical protein